MVPRSSRTAVGSGDDLGGINRWCYRIDLHLGTFCRVNSWEMTDVVGRRGRSIVQGNRLPSGQVAI